MIRVLSVLTHRVHPGLTVLLRYATNELELRDRSRVATHLARCPRCRSAAEDAAAIAVAARSAPVPRPGQAVLDRVLADRAAGQRVILPAGAADTAARPARRAMGAVAAALVLAAGLAVAGAAWSAWRVGRTREPLADAAGTSPTVTSSPESEMNLSTTHSVIAAMSLWPSVAFAQGVTEPPEADSAPPLVSVDGSQLTPGTSTLERRHTTDSVLTRDGGRGRIRLDTAVFGGATAWRVVTTWSAPRASVDTLYLRRSDLRPLARVWHSGRARLEQSFGADSVVEIFTAPTSSASPLAGRAFVRRTVSALPPRAGAVVADESSLRLLMRILPLHARWRGNVGLVSATIDTEPGAVPRMLALHVTGEGAVTTPDGRFDCWRVTFVLGGQPQIWYVDKATGAVVRTESALGSGFVVETLLLGWGQAG